MTYPDAARKMPKDFSRKREKRPFTVDGETYHAPANLAPKSIREVIRLYAELGDVNSINLDNLDGMEKMLDAVGAVLEALVPGADGKRLRARLDDDEAPLDLVEQALPILYWLLEDFGLRPTQPSSPSSAGSTDGPTSDPSAGTFSTDGASPTETDAT